MKTLTQRNKILLGIAGLVIVVVIAGVVLVGPSQTGLFGTSGLVITPSNPVHPVNVYYNLSVNSVNRCNWSTSDAAIVSFLGDYTEEKVVTVIGLHSGQAIIEAKCGFQFFNVNHVSTIVTVE